MINFFMMLSLSQGSGMTYSVLAPFTLLAVRPPCLKFHYGIRIKSKDDRDLYEHNRNRAHIFPIVCTSLGSTGSVNDVNDRDEDEISKLITKRNLIKRKKQDDIVDPTVTATGESILDIDLNSLPEFKTERPIRHRAASTNELNGGNGIRSTGADIKKDSVLNKKKEMRLPIVDFRAEYDDENDLHIPNRMGVSTRAWGDARYSFLASGKLTKRDIKSGKFVPGDAQLAHTKLLEGGIVLFETSPSYGATSRTMKLSAEDILRRCLEEVGEGLPETVLIENLGVTSPWIPILSQISSSSSFMPNRLEDSLTRLGGLAIVELFHAPKSLFIPSRIMTNGLAATVESGQANHIGVTDVTSINSLKRLKNQLDSRDIVLTSNMFDFSLTNHRRNERVIQACKSLGIIPLIRNPLDDGLASGVFTASNPTGGGRIQVSSGKKFTFSSLEKLQPLHSVLETVSERVKTRVRREIRDIQEGYKSRFGPPPEINTDITTTQIALNYVISKGGIPLPEVNTVYQATEVLGCLGWNLNDDEVNMLDSAAALCSL